jgi:hypothetical protein
MSNGAAGARALLDAWRERGTGPVDPVRFHFLDALARRAAGLDGAARRALDARLAGLLESLAAEPGPAAETPGNAQAATAEAGDAEAAAAARGPLGELADALAAQAAARNAAFPELAMLADFRDLWSRLRAESQLRQSLEPAPSGAGPLNSGSLVHRALTLMRELAPEHLQQFLSYVDTLAWLEDLHAHGTLATTGDAPRATSARKRGR